MVMGDNYWDHGNWDEMPATEDEIHLLKSMVRDRDWTGDESLSNRRWVIKECYANGFDTLTHAEVTDLANYFRRFKRHKQTPPERREHLSHVFASEGVEYSG